MTLLIQSVTGSIAPVFLFILPPYFSPHTYMWDPGQTDDFAYLIFSPHTYMALWSIYDDSADLICHKTVLL